MVSELYRQCYRTLQQLLQRWQLAIADPAIGPVSLQTQFSEIQQFVQQRLLTLDLDALVPSEATKIQSVQTEINKQMRLLGTDLPFLQAARQAQTAQQRRQQMSDRVDLLQRYCQMILQEQESEPNPDLPIDR